MTASGYVFLDKALKAVTSAGDLVSTYRKDCGVEVLKAIASSQGRDPQKIVTESETYKRAEVLSQLIAANAKDVSIKKEALDQINAEIQAMSQQQSFSQTQTMHNIEVTNQIKNIDVDIALYTEQLQNSEELVAEIEKVTPTVEEQLRLEHEKTEPNPKVIKSIQKTISDHRSLKERTAEDMENIRQALANAESNKRALEKELQTVAVDAPDDVLLNDKRQYQMRLSDDIQMLMQKLEWYRMELETLNSSLYVEPKDVAISPAQLLRI